MMNVLEGQLTSLSHSLRLDTFTTPLVFARGSSDIVPTDLLNELEVLPFHGRVQFVSPTSNKNPDSQHKLNAKRWALGLGSGYLNYIIRVRGSQVGLFWTP